MSEERMRILEMVREGKVTAEEGARLLEALRPAEAPRPGGERGERGERGGRPGDPISSIVSAVVEALQSRGWGGFGGSWSSGPLRGLERRRQREAEGWQVLPLSDGDHGTFDLPEGASVMVEHDGGGIRAGATDGPARLDLEGDATHDFEVYVARKGNDVVVAAYRTAPFARLPRLVVSVPRHAARVALHTAGGGLQARDFACPLALHTAGGGITVEGQLGGAVEARTSGGGIKVEGTPGGLTLHTSGGSIRFRGRTEAVDARTSGGSIDVDGARLTSGEHRARTSGGSVRLNLAPDSSVAISARTSAGSLSVDLPGAQGTQTGSRISPRYEGTFNGAGARLDVSTAAGSVTIGLAAPAAGSAAA